MTNSESKFDPENPNPFWKGSFQFVEEKGVQHVNGKSYAPNSVALQFTRPQALKIIHQLSSQLVYPDEEEIQLLLFGELDEVQDDELIVHIKCAACDREYNGSIQSLRGGWRTVQTHSSLIEPCPLLGFTFCSDCCQERFERAQDVASLIKKHGLL